MAEFERAEMMNSKEGLNKSTCSSSDYSNQVEKCDEDEGDFIGRKHFFDVLETKFVKTKIFGVFGLRVVGKSRFVEEFIKRIQRQRVVLRDHCAGSQESKEESSPWKPINILKVDLRQLVDIGSLYANLCSSLGISPDLEAINGRKWIGYIVKAFQKRQDELFIVNFDNAEDMIEQHSVFLSLVLELARRCNNLKIFISSTTKIQFASFCSFFPLELPPLSPSETATLLQNTAPVVDFGENLETIVKLSEGLPLLILMIGAELMEEGRCITPREMVEMLVEFRLEALSREFYPPEQRAGKFLYPHAFHAEFASTINYVVCQIERYRNFCYLCEECSNRQC